MSILDAPLLLDSPATDSNKPSKNKSILKSTMKNIFPPAGAPCASRSTFEGADPVAFDDNVDIPAALGASPVPNNLPTHPTLYNGSLAFGSPHGSKLTRVHQFPTPNTTSDDDQKLPAKKKRRTSKPGRKAYFNVQVLNDFNDALNEDRNLHLDNKCNSKLPKQYPAPIIENIKTRPVAATSNKAAKMQTSTNFNTIDDKPTKLGTTIDLDGPNIIHFTPTNDICKHLDLQVIMKKKSSLLTLQWTTTKRTQHTPTYIGTTTQQNNLKTPPKAPLSPP